MTPRDPEYDAFGPWILEIGERNPVPAVFAHAMTRTDVPLASFKVPRLIERRNARPGMHLYDYVVALYANDVLILERDGDGVRTNTVPYSEISYIRSVQDLLRGVLELATPTGSYRLPYSTVSRQIVDSAVGLIRARYTSGTPVPVPPDHGTIGLSYHFEGLLRSIRSEEPRLRVLASQPDKLLADLPGSWRRRHRDRISGKRLLENVHLGDGQELRTLGRGRRFAFRWQSIYGTETCHIPVHRIQAAHWHESGRVRELELSTDGGSVRYAFITDDAALEGYATYLDTVVAGAR
jgi:hypothetical protein